MPEVITLLHATFTREHVHMHSPGSMWKAEVARVKNKKINGGVLEDLLGDQNTPKIKLGSHS